MCCDVLSITHWQALLHGAYLTVYVTAMSFHV